MSESTDCKNFLDKCTLELKQVSSVPVSRTLQEWSRISEKSLSDGCVKQRKKNMHVNQSTLEHSKVYCTNPFIKNAHDSLCHNVNS